MRLTVDSIMAFKPCKGWTRERVEAWFGERVEVEVQIALLDDTI